MREWILALAPVAAIVYFLIHPDQLEELLFALYALLRWY